MGASVPKARRPKAVNLEENRERIQERRPERQPIDATLDATVLEALPGSLYAVELGSGHRVLAHMANELRLVNQRLLPGERVSIKVSPRDASQGRIIAVRRGGVSSRGDGLQSRES